MPQVRVLEMEALKGLRTRGLLWAQAPMLVVRGVDYTLTIVAHVNNLPPSSLSCPATVGTVNIPYASAFTASSGTGTFACLSRARDAQRSFRVAGGEVWSCRGAASVGASCGSPPLGLRVLVAEDNVLNQKVAALLLGKLGCAVQVVANGKEAVDMVRMTPYDVVLMDCEMPVMDGFQATAAIRFWETNSRHVPIIALTAHAMAGTSERCAQAGMDGHLSKPVSMHDLRGVLQSLRNEGDSEPVR